MNRITYQLARQTEVELKNLMEPVSDYIAATGTVAEQKVVLIAAVLILVNDLEEINREATDYLDGFTPLHIG